MRSRELPPFVIGRAPSSALADGLDSDNPRVPAMRVGDLEEIITLGPSCRCVLLARRLIPDVSAPAFSASRGGEGNGTRSYNQLGWAIYTAHHSGLKRLADRHQASGLSMARWHYMSVLASLLRCRSVRFAVFTAAIKVGLWRGGVILERRVGSPGLSPPPTLVIEVIAVTPFLSLVRSQ